MPVFFVFFRDLCIRQVNKQRSTDNVKNESMLKRRKKHKSFCRTPQQ